MNRITDSFLYFFCSRWKIKQTAGLKAFFRSHEDVTKVCHILSECMAHQLPDKKRITPSTHRYRFVQGYHVAQWQNVAGSKFFNFFRLLFMIRQKESANIFPVKRSLHFKHEEKRNRKRK